MDLVALALVVHDVFCETTIHGDPARVEILAENSFTPSAIEAVIALISQTSREPLGWLFRAEGTYGNAYVGDDAVAELEVLYVLPLLDEHADRLMSGDKLSEERARVSRSAWIVRG